MLQGNQIMSQQINMAKITRLYCKHMTSEPIAEPRNDWVLVTLLLCTCRETFAIRCCIATTWQGNVYLLWRLTFCKRLHGNKKTSNHSFDRDKPTFSLMFPTVVSDLLELQCLSHRDFCEVWEWKASGEKFSSLESKTSMLDTRHSIPNIASTHYHTD